MKFRYAVLGAIALSMSIANGERAPASEPLIVSERFKTFSLFSQEQSALKLKVIVAFHGFASAMPNGAYKRLNKALSTQYSVLGFNYDYFDLDANKLAFDRAWHEVLSDYDVTFVGTSLGGFWANAYAAQYGVTRVILVNPVVDPHQQLQQFVGEHYVEKRDLTLVVDQADIDQYEGLLSPKDDTANRLVILTRDDTVLDYNVAKEHFGDGATNQVLVMDTGGHTVNLREPQIMNEILRFLGVD